MTRTTDRDVAWSDASNGEELQARVDKTPPGAAVFVSIHCNASGLGRAHGTETYFFPCSFHGQRLAFSVQREIVRQLETNNRGLKMGLFYVLKHTAMPAILVETAFIDNINDNKLLKERRADFAKAITDGILNYLKTL